MNEHDDDLERMRIERLREQRFEAAAEQIGPPLGRDHDRQPQRFDPGGQASQSQGPVAAYIHFGRLDGEGKAAGSINRGWRRGGA